MTTAPVGHRRTTTPVTVRSERFELPTPRGMLRGLRQFQPDNHDPVGRVIVAPPFGTVMRRGRAVALYFLLNGFDVIRYDPTNHVGESDGTILELTPDALAADLALVHDWVASCGPRSGPAALFTASIASRIAFAAAARSGRRPVAIGAISAVVDMQATIAAANDQDFIGQWLRGEQTDPDRTALVLDHEVKWRFVQRLVELGWHTTESTHADVRSIESVPILAVQGSRDSWVDLHAVEYAFRDHASAAIVVLSDATHELNTASARTALAELVRFFRPAPAADDPVLAPTFAHVVAQNKGERQIDRSQPDGFAVEVTHCAPFDYDLGPGASSAPTT